MEHTEPSGTRHLPSLPLGTTRQPPKPVKDGTVCHSSGHLSLFGAQVLGSATAEHLLELWRDTRWWWPVCFILEVVFNCHNMDLMTRFSFCCWVPRGKSCLISELILLQTCRSFPCLVSDTYLCRPTGLSWESDLLCVRWCQRGRSASQPGRLGGSCHAAAQWVACSSTGRCPGCSKQGSSHSRRRKIAHHYYFVFTCHSFYFISPEQKINVYIMFIILMGLSHCIHVVIVWPGGTCHFQAGRVFQWLYACCWSGMNLLTNLLFQVV